MHSENWKVQQCCSLELGNAICCGNPVWIHSQLPHRQPEIRPALSYGRGLYSCQPSTRGRSGSCSHASCATCKATGGLLHWETQRDCAATQRRAEDLVTHVDTHVSCLAMQSPGGAWIRRRTIGARLCTAVGVHTAYSPDAYLRGGRPYACPEYSGPGTKVQCYQAGGQRVCVQLQAAV